MLLSFQCKAKYDCTGVSLSDQTKSPRSLLPFICLCFPLHPNHVHHPLSVQHFLNLSSCFSFLFCLSRIVAPVSPALSAPPCLVWISPASTSPNPPPPPTCPSFTLASASLLLLCHSSLSTPQPCDANVSPSRAGG